MVWNFVGRVVGPPPYLVSSRLGGPGVEGGVVSGLLVPLPVVIVAHHVHIILNMTKSSCTRCVLVMP
jgi:hypothetical protein